MTIITVYEENHGLILCAKDFNAAKRALLTTDWVYGGCDVWCPDGEYRCIMDIYGDKWKEVFLSDVFDEEKMESMGFTFHKEEVYE